MGINNDSSLAVVLFVKQVDQLTGRTAVKIPPGADMKIAVTLCNLDLKIAAHLFSSYECYWLRILLQMPLIYALVGHRRYP
jgi:hypothetical protein